ncbi:MAG: proline--tRNA ligase [SAR202 cluster bacterium]|nr:proline--tRNA ligase [SAR202 cluster bacterium]
MRVSKMFGKTQRDDPAEAELPSHKLMLKAGMIYQASAGIYAYLPMAWRSLRKIERIIREEMDAAGGQELRMPALQPREIWQQSGRDAAYGPDAFRLQDRRDRQMLLAPTHEELLTNIVKANVLSYRDLPLILYQIQTKFRDEPRPRGGLIRVREFDMKDAYSFDADDVAFDASYQAMVQAYKNIYARCGLDAIMVQADSGAIGGKDSHEFILLADSGEDTIVLCPSCGYAANAEKAAVRKSPLPAEEPASTEEVATPGVGTIEELSEFLDIPSAKTLKAVFYMADGRLSVIVIRGDLEVNEIKLHNALDATDLRLASPGEVKEAGIVAGSASPVGLDGVHVVADDSVELGANFVVGANKEGHHLKNVNYPRDFTADILTDIALAAEGDACIDCATPVETRRGIEVGHVFKLGILYSKVFDATFPDQNGDRHPISMGCYGIGVGRLLAAAIEQHHDDRGMIFPGPIAPFDVHLLALNADNEDVAKAAEALYAQLGEAGFETLFDDRTDTAGVKFNDADLLGLPIRVVVSPRNLKQDVVEIKLRSSDDAVTVAPDEALGKIRELLGA